MDKVVVTGSSGRIGRALQWKLAKNFDVVGIDRSPGSATTVIGDITNQDLLKKSFEGASTVFHAAALHAPHVGIASDKDFHRINVEATSKICESAIACGVKKIVFTSTTAIYGYANLGEGAAAWINEKTTPQPRTIYHRTKLEAENILREFAGGGLAIRVMRMSRCFPEPAPSMAVYRLHRGVDYRDVADAHLLAAATSDDIPFDLYLISGSTPFEPSDCQELFENAAGIISRRCTELAMEFDQRGWQLPKSIDRVYDTSYAKSKLGWQSKRGSMHLLDQYDQEDFEILPGP